MYSGSDMKQAKDRHANWRSEPCVFQWEGLIDILTLVTQSAAIPTLYNCIR